MKKKKEKKEKKIDDTAAVMKEYGLPRAFSAAVFAEAHWFVDGTVNRRVPAGTRHTAVWRPDRLAEPVDIASVKPVLTAWNVDVPPQKWRADAIERQV